MSVGISFELTLLKQENSYKVMDPVDVKSPDGIIFYSGYCNDYGNEITNEVDRGLDYEILMGDYDIYQTKVICRFKRDPVDLEYDFIFDIKDIEAKENIEDNNGTKDKEIKKVFIIFNC